MRHSPAMIEHLTKFRKKHNLTFRQFAAMVNVNKTTAIRWENGDVRIPPERFADLERVTGISRKKLRPDIFGPAP